MLDFMVIGLPRSGTTWAANWLTTNTTFCLHDPLYKAHYKDWDSNEVHFPTNKKYQAVGISCTGIWRWVNWVNAHPAKKIILARPFREVQDSLEKAGFSSLEDDAPEILAKINAPKILYTDLFDPYKAELLWEYIIGSGFCQYRHKMLAEMILQPENKKVNQDKVLERKLWQELDGLDRNNKIKCCNTFF